MAFDFALDPDTGDWIMSPNLDFQPVLGDQTVAQRIRVRLRIENGWDLDPTQGRLGSQLRGALRLSRSRLLNEAPLLVRQALAPMDDIQINDVIVEPSGDQRSALIHIKYTVVDLEDERPLDVQSQDVVSFSVAT